MSPQLLLLVGLLYFGQLDINHSGAHGVGSLRDAVCQGYDRYAIRSFHSIHDVAVSYRRCGYGIVEFNVPLDTV